MAAAKKPAPKKTPVKKATKTVTKTSAKPVAPKKVTTKKVVAKKSIPKKAASKKAPAKSSILSYSRPMEFEQTAVKASDIREPTDSVIANPSVSTASPELDKPTLPAEQLASGDTAMISIPAADAPEASSPLAASQTLDPEAAEAADVISGAPLPSSVLLPAADESGRASSISLPPSVRKIQRQRIIKRVLAVVAVVALLIAAGFWFVVYRGKDVQTANQQLISEVSKKALVPTDETPSVTTVVDETKLNQEFLRSARKGDKVLLYFQAGRAVVYRPSSHQIVNMGPLQAPRPRVFIRNGAPQDNVAAITSTINSSADFIVSSRDESPKKSYPNTIVVDVAGNRPDVAQRLAKLINATVGTMPDGETRPDADLLVIVGSDYKPAQ